MKCMHEEHGQRACALMNVMRAPDGISDSREKVSVSLTASTGTNDESCDGGRWGIIIDIGGAMSIIIDDYIMLFGRIVEQSISSSIECT